MTAMEGRSMRRRILMGVAVAIAAAALIALYGIFDPAEGRFPRCPFLTLTGWQCPGCGSQRAAHALLHGNLAQAWGYNAVMVCALPLLALLAVAEIMRPRWPRFHAALNSRIVCLATAAIFVIWCVARNLW